MSGPPGAGLGFAIVRALDWFGCCTPSSSRTRSGGDPPPAGRPINVVESPPTQAALQEHLIGIDAHCGAADEAPQQAPGSPLRRASMQGGDVCRQVSWNTQINIMREASPFFRVSQQAGYKSSHPQYKSVELRDANTNVLLGQYHLEGQGRFVKAHPGVVVRRSQPHGEN